MWLYRTLRTLESQAAAAEAAVTGPPPTSDGGLSPGTWAAIVRSNDQAELARVQARIRILTAELAAREEAWAPLAAYVEGRKDAAVRMAARLAEATALASTTHGDGV